MKFRESRHDQIHIFHLEGEIDMHYAPALRALFKGKSDRRCPVLVLDMSGVGFIDSVGISVLLEYLRDATEFGGHFCIVGLTTPVRHIFDIVQLHKALPIFNDLNEAKAALSHGRVPLIAEPLFGVEHGKARAAAANAA